MHLHTSRHPTLLPALLYLRVTLRLVDESCSGTNGKSQEKVFFAIAAPATDTQPKEKLLAHVLLENHWEVRTHYTPTVPGHREDALYANCTQP